MTGRPDQQDIPMNLTTHGFTGRRRTYGVALPPGQHVTPGFPVLSAGPTPSVDRASWELTLVTTGGQRRRWDFAALAQLPADDITVDLHCVTGWSKLRTRWRGVPLGALLADVDDAGAHFAMVHSYGGYTTNISLQDLVDGRAWLTFEYEEEPLIRGTTPEPPAMSCAGHRVELRGRLGNWFVWDAAGWR